MTTYLQHVRQWEGCEACKLHRGRRNMVFARGQIPADLVFIGEAPGESEDVIGRPFVGPAGRLLQDIIDDALQYRPATRFALTNLVCCIPRDEEGGKAGEPTDDAVRACEPRLEEFIRLARPKLLVLVGSLAERHVPKMLFSAGLLKTLPTVAIVHPAYILRIPLAARSLQIKRAVVTIQNAIEKYLYQEGDQQ